MKQRVASALLALLGVLWTVFAVVALVAASVRISDIANPALRRLAFSGEIVVGVFWLLGAVYVATHLAVIVFAKPKPENGR